MSERRDVWARGDAYDAYVGRWSRLVARAFLDWLAAPEGRVWLDVGCVRVPSKMEVMRYFWNAAVALSPEARDLNEGVRFQLCKPHPVRQLFGGAGLRDVRVDAIEVPTHLRDFDDYWLPFLGGQGPAPGYAMSLSEERRTELRERIRGCLPVEADGSIRLMARAWAIRGRP